MAATNASPKDSLMTLKKQLDDFAALTKSNQDSLTRKRLHHFSHISTDSVTTADDDDFSDRHGHRRCLSGAESLSSDLTEFAEPAICRDRRDLRDTNGDLDMDMSSPSPSMSAHSPTPLHDPWGLTSYFALNAQQQLQQQQQHQIDSIHSNHYARREEDSNDAFDNISSPRALSSRHSLASILTTALGHSSSSLSSVAQQDPFDLKNHFSGESMEIIDSGSCASSPLTSEFHRQQLDDPSGIMERSLPDLEKKNILARLFSRAASNGDRARMQDMLEHFRDWIDLDAQDEDGTSPLIYAACFGHVEIASMLLEAGAVVDARDRFGWTALVWATNNKHDNMVRLLLEQGASTSAQTVKGHTIVDFLRHDPNDNSKIVQIFQEPCRRDSSSSDGYPTGNDPFYLPGVDESEDTRIHSNDQRARTTSEGAHIAFNVSMASLRKADQLDDDGDFDWDRCLPDQMFVFSYMDIPHILNVTITTMEPTRVRPYKPVPAYVLFLAARFAHHYSTSGLLDELLDATTRAISDVTQGRPEDMTLTAYWISNASALLCFLRRDSGLSGATKLHRARIEKMIEEMVQLLVLDAERRIEGILEQAMLDHDTIAGLDEVKFQSDWAFWRGSTGGYNTKNNNGSNSNNKRASFPLSALPALYPRPLKRSSSQSSVHGPNRPTSPRQRQISPRTITTMLSSLLFVMQNYDLHPETIQYVISQLLRYISFEIFNRMITNKRLLSRTKALQTRLNLSILEDWVRFNHLSRQASDQCKPLVQLLQLLQVLSLQGEIDTWVETVKNLDLLTPIQLRRIVTNYRFEVNEPRVPSPIKQLVLQTAIDTEKTIKQQSSEKKQQQQQQQQSEAQRSSSETDGSSSDPSTRRYSNSASSRSSSPVAKLIISNMFINRTFDDDMEGYIPGEDDDSGRWINTTSPLLSSHFAEGERETLARQQQLQKEEEEREAEVLSETRNSQSWIPFTVPANLAERGHGVERVFVPQIPEEMMSLLDTYSFSY